MPLAFVSVLLLPPELRETPLLVDALLGFSPTHRACGVMSGVQVLECLFESCVLVRICDLTAAPFL